MKPRQKKSRTYYWFWGVCTVAVCAGQFYVGSGYRKMSESVDNLLHNLLTKPIVIDVVPERDGRFLNHDSMAREVPST